MILTAFFSALTIIGAKLNILIFDIPITLQPVIITLAGCLIGSKAAFFSQVVYIIIGLMGIPVFAKPIAGPAYLLQPSFGYLIGFVFAAYIIGMIIERSQRKSVFIFISASMIGLIIIYIFGIIYIYGLMNLYLGKPVDMINVLMIGVLPFVIKDIALNILASILAFTVYKRIKLYI